MARDLKLNIDGDSHGGQRALEEAAAAADLAAREADKLGKQFKQAARDAADLDRKLLETTVAARALAVEFAKTNDTGIKKQLDAQKKAASELKTLRRDVVGDSEKVAQEAEKFAKQAASELTKMQKAAEAAAGSFSDLAPSFGPVGIGVAAVAAVPALAGAGGAITAGAGLGAVGLGVAGAVAGDPERFKAEWSKQIGAVKADWISASAAFTGPTLAAIRSIGPLFDGLHIDRTLATAAGYVRPLVSGIEGFVVNIEGGIDKLVQKAGPVFTELEAVLPDFGAQIADGLGAIADNAQGGAQALGDIIQLAGGVTDAILQAVAGAEALYGGFKKADVAVANFIRDNQGGLSAVTFGLSDLALKASDAFNSDEVAHYGAALQGVAQTGSLAADSTAALAAATAAEQKALDATNHALDTAINNTLGLSGANINAAQAFADLSKEYKKGAGSLDVNTQKGRDNLTLIDSTISTLERQREASIAAGDGSAAASAAANKAYNDQLTKLQQVIDKANGGKSSIDAFINSFRDKSFTITQHVVTVYSNVGSVSQQGVISGKVPRQPGAAYAEGTNWAAAGVALVGEHGPEIVQMHGGERVLTAAQTRSVFSGVDVDRRTPVPSGLFGRGGTGGGRQQLELVVSGAGGAGLEAILATWLAKSSRTGTVQIFSKALV